MPTDNRPTKKQRELLNYIDAFIKQAGYGPSYREIMRALDYKSVSTVAVHVDGLIARGFLRKTDNSARSLEVLNMGVYSYDDAEAHRAWLKKQLARRVSSASDEFSAEDRAAMVRVAGLLGIEIVA